MDDFGPAKNLMTMCFTYYHIGKTRGSGGGRGWVSPWKANLKTQDLSTSSQLKAKL